MYKLVVTRCGSEKQWGGGGARAMGGRGERRGRGGVVEVMGKI